MSREGSIILSLLRRDRFDDECRSSFGVCRCCCAVPSATVAERALSFACCFFESEPFRERGGVGVPAIESPVEEELELEGMGGTGGTNVVRPAGVGVARPSSEREGDIPGEEEPPVPVCEADAPSPEPEPEREPVVLAVVAAVGDIAGSDWRRL